jgi:DNA-binding MarR family transcriptional regulator
MARILEHSGLIRRGTKPGDRREYFYVPPDAARRLIERGTEQMRASREVIDAGLALIADRPPASRERLQDLRDMYAFFEREWPSLLDRLHQIDAEASDERKEATA